MDELLIQGGRVLDGSGSAPFAADVVVRDGRIAAIERPYPGQARRIVDARGQIVAPGFIDIHSHSDFTLTVNPRAESKVRQGVTTEVVGNCGFSVAPVLRGRVALLRDYLAPSAPWLDCRETTFSAYAEGFPPTTVNVVLQAGHNTLRLMTMGMEKRAPTPRELKSMQDLLEDALKAGALGLSSGLFTAPGSYASSDEMLALGQILRRYGGSYAAHVRNEADQVFDAVREAIALGETCGVHVQISHLKLSGTDNWGGAGKLLEEIDAARRRGVRVDCDQYPYTAATNALRNLLPTWVPAGGLDMMLRRLAEPDVRARIRAEIAAHGLQSFGRIPSWDMVRIALSSRPQYVGATIGEIARKWTCDPIDALCDYLIADHGVTRVVVTSMAEPDVREILKSPTVLIGSDGVAVAPYGPTRVGKPHPRFYGAFPRVLGHYTRDLALVPLPLAVHKMTGASAQALGLRDRGLLRVGNWADITVFDPATVAERATYDEPHQYPVGISTVIVNGVVVVEEAQHTGALPGKLLRRTNGSVG